MKYLLVAVFIVLFFGLVASIASLGVWFGVAILGVVVIYTLVKWYFTKNS
jgi:hypothetical protein